MKEQIVLEKKEMTREERIQKELSEMPKPQVHRMVKSIDSEEYEERINKEKRLEYLGINIDVFDGNEEEDPQLAKDEILAIMLINRNEPVPQEVEKRLLERKQRKEMEDME